MDSIYSFPIKKCPPIKKAVFALVKKMVEWKVTDIWDEENNWLLEGRTVLIFKGGDRKDPVNYRPITCLPTITKMVTLPSTSGCGNGFLATSKLVSSIGDREESEPLGGARKR